jgi:uncharacterized membrane protein YphA (DoxX/SURF4 family)
MNAVADSLSKPGTRAVTVFTWVLRILLAGVFLSGAVMKLTGAPMMIAEFQQVGLGDWFRYFTGALELVGGLAILLPAVSPLGAALLLVVDLGACIAQVRVLHQDWIHTIVIGTLLAVLIYLQRARLSERFGRAA